MLTIEPGLFFSHSAVRFMRLAGLTDEDVAQDLDAIESGCLCPIEFIRREQPKCNWIGLYVAGLCRCADIDVRGVFGAQ